MFKGRSITVHEETPQPNNSGELVDLGDVAELTMGSGTSDNEDKRYIYS